MLIKDIRFQVQYEEKYGGIVLDSSKPPSASAPGAKGVGVGVGDTSSSGSFHFSPSNVNTSSPAYLEALSLKAHLCVRMLEKRIGAEQLLQVLNKQLSLATAAAQVRTPDRSYRNFSFVRTEAQNRAFRIMSFL